MTLREIEDNLPNGLHDAQVKRIEIDYEKKRIKFTLALWIGDLSSQDESVRESFQEGELILTDLIYCIIEPPDPTYSFLKASPITIGAGSATEDPIKTETILPSNLPDGAFAYWFFVHEWNSFIHIAAMDASIELKDRSTTV
jgi:hypothetical protein